MFGPFLLTELQELSRVYRPHTLSHFFQHIFCWTEVGAPTPPLCCPPNFGSICLTSFVHLEDPFVTYCFNKSTSFPSSFLLPQHDAALKNNIMTNVSPESKIFVPVCSCKGWTFIWGGGLGAVASSSLSDV